MAENPLLSNLVAAWGGDESAIPEHEVEPFPDETRCPLVNDLVRLARRYMAGMSGAHEFVAGMQKTMVSMRACLFNQREMIPLLNLDPAQQEMADEAERALYSFLEALGEMVASFTQEDLPLVEVGIDLCKEATVTLEKWYDELSRLQRREFGLICRHCGHYAQPLQTRCPSCVSELPGADEFYDPEQDWAIAPRAYTRLYEGLLESVKSESSPQGRETWVVDVGYLIDKFTRVRISLAGVTELEPLILDGRPAVVEKIDELLHAVDISRKALIEIQRFATHRCLADLDEAWYHLIDVLPVLNRCAFEGRHSLIGLLDYLGSDEYRASLEAASEEYQEITDGM